MYYLQHDQTRKYLSKQYLLTKEYCRKLTKITNSDTPQRSMAKTTIITTAIPQVKPMKELVKEILFGFTHLSVTD